MCILILVAMNLLVLDTSSECIIIIWTMMQYDQFMYLMDFL